MKTINLSCCKAYLAASNKKFFAEIPRRNIQINKLKKLTPQTDIDGKIITYSTNPKQNFIYPTRYEDCFEKMSFEQHKERQFFRDNELYNPNTDNYSYHLAEKYSYDDIPMPETVAYKDIGFKNRIQSIYYPNTKFSFNDESKLKFINFKEFVVPSTFDRRIKLNPDTIRNLAAECTHVWENGMPTQNIIRLLERSVVKTKNRPFGYPEEGLFKFLVKYPTKRSQVVAKAKNGVEYFDNHAAFYLETFKHKLFSSEETALKVLEECKTYDNFPVPTVNKKICNMVYILRRRSALGLPKDANLDNLSMYQTYCLPSTPWGEKESELIKRLKPNGFIDDEAFEVAQKLLVHHNKTIDYTLEYMDSFIAQKNVVKKIMSKYETKYSFTYASEQEKIQELLEREILVNDNKTSEQVNQKIITPFVQEMQEKELPIRETLKFAQILDQANYNMNIDTEGLLKFINTCLDDKNLTQKNKYSILNSLHKIFANKTNAISENELQLINKVYQHTSNGEIEYCTALEKLLGMHTRIDKPILKIAESNLDEYAKYIKDTTKIINRGHSKNVREYLQEFAEDEESKFLTDKKVNAEDIKALKILSNLELKNVKYPDIIDKIKAVRRKLNAEARAKAKAEAEAIAKAKAEAEAKAVAKTEVKENPETSKEQ